ncbi:hypothetical protein [Erwinia sp. Leaf53]|uniref:hypothetical protein n=1 Tax=Erwinia sp. Leaf53 TaxID=1736225 RepID=UPI0006F67F58|nr:hypothetical protein [Erwinia sp. Leaf53]KQN54915.1 hypothetical protein ASF13_10765 [Erwinia sp. Leaf53]
MSEQSLLMARLATLEAEAAIRRLVSDSLHLCESLTSGEVAQETGRLFTADAQWLVPQGDSFLIQQKVVRLINAEDYLLAIGYIL